jgi:PAS domain S-box-containing protein
MLSQEGNNEATGACGRSSIGGCERDFAACAEQRFTAPRAANPKKAIRILIVEDEQLTALFIKTLLLNNEYEIAAMALTGEEAVARAKEHRPDLILMDIMLQGDMNGVQAAHEIKKELNIPVVFITACSDEWAMEESKISEPYGYIIKPFVPKELISTMKMALYRYELQIKLQESEERFRLLFEKESDAIIIFDTASRIIFDINMAAQSLYGYEKNEVAGKDLLLLMNEDNYERLCQEFTKNNEGSAFILLREEHFRKDGSRIPVACRGRIIKFNGKEHVYLSMRDITDKIRQEEEKTLLQAHLMQTEKMAALGILAAGIAHEINNPMAFIASNLSTMDKYIKRITNYTAELLALIEAEGSAASVAKMNEKKGELKIDFLLNDAADLIAESASGAERVTKIVQDLKLFTHQGGDEPELFDVHACMEKTINIVWNELKYKTTIKKEYGDIPQIKGFSHQIGQVFMNLLVNAAHSIEKEGVITIKTWTLDGSVCISIADTGCGISESNLARIFEPFFTTKEEGIGSGLGLSIAYDTVTNKHHGRLTVASEVGAGTTFTIKLPCPETEEGCV